VAGKQVMSGRVVLDSELDQNICGRDTTFGVRPCEIHRVSPVFFIDWSLIDWRAQNAIHFGIEVKSFNPFSGLGRIGRGIRPQDFGRRNPFGTSFEVSI